MKRTALAAAACLALSACATSPADYSGQLNENDAKWNSPDCKQIRLDAVNFDEKIGQRVAIGIGAGLLLGPFGIPLAAAADSHQNDRRRAFDREMWLRCQSAPLPEALKDKPPSAPATPPAHR